MAAAYIAYRHWVKDVYVLAGGVLSAIVITTTLIVKQLKMADAGTLLFIGMLVIGMSAAGGFWLKQVATEEDT
jgi:cell division protein FtsW (lipid II flippase)